MNRVGGEEVTEKEDYMLSYTHLHNYTHTQKHTEQGCLQGTAALQTPPSITHCSVTAYGVCLKPTLPHNQSNLWMWENETERERWNEESVWVNESVSTRFAGYGTEGYWRSVSLSVSFSGCEERRDLAGEKWAQEDILGSFYLSKCSNKTM